MIAGAQRPMLICIILHWLSRLGVPQELRSTLGFRHTQTVHGWSSIIPLWYIISIEQLYNCWFKPRLNQHVSPVFMISQHVSPFQLVMMVICFFFFVAFNHQVLTNKSPYTWAIFWLLNSEAKDSDGGYSKPRLCLDHGRLQVSSCLRRHHKIWICIYIYHYIYIYICYKLYYIIYILYIIYYVYSLVVACLRDPPDPHSRQWTRVDRILHHGNCWDLVPRLNVWTSSKWLLI